MPTTDSRGNPLIVEPTSVVATIDLYHQVAEADETDNFARVSLR